MLSQTFPTVPEIDPVVVLNVIKAGKAGDIANAMGPLSAVSINWQLLVTRLTPAPTM